MRIAIGVLVFQIIECSLVDLCQCDKLCDQVGSFADVKYNFALVDDFQSPT